MAERHVSRFPKEFKKKQIISFDWRFAIILVLSMVAHVGLVFVLKNHLPAILQASYINQVQQQYANLVLERDQDLERILPTERLDVVYGNRSTIDVGIGPAETPGPPAAIAVGPLSGGPVFSGGTAESRLPTVAEMGQGGIGSRVRGRDLRDVIGEVGNIGLLGVLTAGSGVVEAGFINSIINFGDAQNAQLGNILNGLDAVRVSKGPEGIGWGASAGREGNPAGERITTGNRGTRIETRALDVNNLIGALQPQGEVTFEKIDRVADYEVVSELVAGRPEIPTTPEEKALLRRKPEHVMAIVNQHRPAIIDCYKGLLRNNPSLKGKVEIRFAINSDGQVSFVEILQSTIQIERLHSCMVNRIRNWNDFGYGDPTAPDEVYRQIFTFGY
jgi:hypothetical protein